MKIGKDGLDLIKDFEGVELKTYLDIAGVLTIGYGHTGKSAFENNIISDSMAEVLLRDDIEIRERLLTNWASDNGVVFNQNQFDALLSFIYNVGFSGFKGSTAANRLIAGNVTGAAEALQWWNKARIGGKLKKIPGLVRRRAAEAELFLKPVILNEIEIDATKEWRETNVSTVEENCPIFQMLVKIKQMISQF